MYFFDLDLYSSTKSFLDKIPLLAEKGLLLPEPFVILTIYLLQIMVLMILMGNL